MVRTHTCNDVREKQSAYESTLKPQPLWSIHPQTSRFISPPSTRLYRLRISTRRGTNVEVGKVGTKSSERNTGRLWRPYNLSSTSQGSEESHSGVMVDSRQPNTSVITAKPNQLIYRYDSGWRYDSGGEETQAGNNLITGWPSLIAARLHWATGWSAWQWTEWLARWLATDWSVYFVKLGITSSLDGGVIFDARLHADKIRRSHSGGSAMPSAFF